MSIKLVHYSAFVRRIQCCPYTPHKTEMDGCKKKTLYNIIYPSLYTLLVFVCTVIYVLREALWMSKAFEAMNQETWHTSKKQRQRCHRARPEVCMKRKRCRYQIKLSFHSRFCSQKDSHLIPFCFFPPASCFHFSQGLKKPSFIIIPCPYTVHI